MKLDREAIEKIAAGRGYRLIVPELRVDVDLSERAKHLSALLDMLADYEAAWARVAARRSMADLSLAGSIDRLANERDALLRFKSSVDEALNSGDGTYRP